VFGFIGGGAGLFADFASFLSERATAGLLLALFAGGAGIAAAFCVRKALSVTERTAANAIAVGECLRCDALRATAVAGLIYFLLMLIGGVFIADADRYQWRFGGGDWKEDTRIGLYHEAPRTGRFELQRRGRQTGAWFGPIVHDYAAA